jgi:hypothetical protein
MKKKTLKAGSNVTIAGTSGEITISASDNDTHYTSNTVIGAANTATANAAASNTALFMNHVENGTVRNSHQITGTGSVSVSSDSSGKLTIAGTDANTVTTATENGTGNGVESVTATNGALTINKANFLTSYTETDPSIDATAMTTSANALSTTGTTGKVYAVQKNSAGKAVVSVPWQNDNTTYIAGTGIAITGNSISSTVTDTNTVTTVNAATGTGNAITSITATNGVLSPVKGSTFLTSETDPTIPTIPPNCKGPSITCSLNFGTCSATENASGTACDATNGSYYWELITR